MSSESDESKHKTIINLDLNETSNFINNESSNKKEVYEEELVKRNLIKPHICDHLDGDPDHWHDHKFKSKVKLNKNNDFSEREILENIQNQIEKSSIDNDKIDIKEDPVDCSIKVEIKSSADDETNDSERNNAVKEIINKPIISTITVQTKQDSNIRNNLNKISIPVSPTKSSVMFFPEHSEQDVSLKKTTNYVDNQQKTEFEEFEPHKNMKQNFDEQDLIKTNEENLEKESKDRNLNKADKSVIIVNNQNEIEDQNEEIVESEIRNSLNKSEKSIIVVNNQNEIVDQSQVSPKQNVTFAFEDSSKSKHEFKTETETLASLNKHEIQNKNMISSNGEPIKKDLQPPINDSFEDKSQDKMIPDPGDLSKQPLTLKPGIGCAESGVFTKHKSEKTSGAPPASVSVETPNRSYPRLPMSSMEEENLRERIRATLLRQCAENVNKEARYSKEMFKRLLQSKEFLEQLFKLFDQDRDNQLHQDNWIEFLKERLSDERQIDFAEQIESVAYVLCGDKPISLDQFIQIFHAKGIVDKLFRLVDQNNVGTISAEQIMDFVSNITNTRPRTGFDKKSLESLEQLFRQTVGNEKEIRREDFQKIVISKNPFFTERVFQIFDKDNSGSISLQEFLDSMHQFAGQSPDDKIKFLFKIYDIDGDGLIQHRELQHVMRACMEENGMQFSEEQIDDLTVAMFEDADANNRGAITYEALKNQLEKHGGLLENLSISIDRWLVPPKPKAPPASFVGKLLALRPYQLTRPYLKNNYVYLIFLAAFIILNLGLFISRAVQYASYGANGYVIVARACGQCLNFNCMFILVLMLRQCITFLRTRGYSSILPLDHHIYLHKMTGMLITFFSVLHTIMHLLNFSLEVVNNSEVNSQNYTLTEWLLTDRPGMFGLVPGMANPTGIVLMIILIVMFICSQAFVRRGGSFEIFYWTHLLYIPFWVLLVFHGPNFWKWFIVPGILYLIERILRLVWMKGERGKTYISSGLLLPSKVTHLVIKRPLHFDFHPGDYVFVNIPAIAKYEWHPFTISSAPEQEDYMWLHIRAVGEWTNRLYNYFEKEQEKLHNGEIPPLISGSQTDKKPQLSIITNETNTLKRIHASIKRKFSNRDPNKKGDAQLIRYTEEKSSSEVPHVSASDGEINNRASSSNETLNYSPLPKGISTEKRLQMLLFHQKVPLEKSLSMPDIQTKAKKRERLLVLREYMRSESERSFDECQIRRARLQSLGLAYLSPQNKSLAQSFRYMRHKPTIIAFKTPSLENCDTRNSSSSLGSVGRQTSAGSFTSNPERQAEEGRLSPFAEISPGATSVKSVNYPVGKPLEPIPEDRSIIEVADLDDPTISFQCVLGNGTEIYLDGPYGAPSSHIFRAQHAVLIATGIGVTPFASILQSIMHRYWKARHCCPKCKFSWASEIPPTVMNLRKVDFFWINRDQRSFEWFVNLLSQLEIEQAELGGAMERFLEMHMYITSALQKTDMKAVGLQLALDLLHEKEKRDLITGLKTRTNAGRPNWDKVFKQIQDQKKGKVTVFYCGPPQLGRILRYKCDQYGFSFRKETF